MAIASSLYAISIFTRFPWKLYFQMVEEICTILQQSKEMNTPLECTEFNF